MATGIGSWWNGGNNKDTTKKPKQSVSKAAAEEEKEVPGMNGAVEVPRPDPNVDLAVFEFGSVAGLDHKATVTGYCPVSDKLEPCLWELVRDPSSDAPKFRIYF